MIRVGIVDDEQLIRDGIRLVLQLTDDLEVVAEAANGAEAVELAARHRPDVILMDIRMPVVDGITATGDRGQSPELPGAHPDHVRPRRLVFDAMRAGASGFLLKDVGHEVLVTGIRSAARGDALVAPSVTRRLIEDFARRPGRAQARRALEPLTEREAKC